MVIQILSLAGQMTNEHGCKNIAPRRLQLALGNNEELENMMKYVMISIGGLMTEIYPFLLKYKNGKKTKEQKIQEL